MQNGLERRDLVRLGVLVLVLLVVSGAVALSSGGGGSNSSSASGPDRGESTGVLTSVTQDGLVLKPVDGGPEERFVVRAVDVRRLDLFHLTQHAEQGLPTRISWAMDQGRKIALTAIDAPVTS